MKLFKTSAILFTHSILLFFPLFLNAQLPKKVDANAINEVITYLASDEFKGRETGTQECILTEEYFANEYKKLKLLPGGGNGSFFYDYSFRGRLDVKDPELVIDKRTFVGGRGEDCNLAFGSTGGNVTAEIVFAGYGINSKEKKRNDFENLDIKGKIVLIKRGAPQKNTGDWRPYSIDSVKAQYCFDNGAVGVMFYEPLERNMQEILVPDYANSLAQFNKIPNFPVLVVDERVVRYVFAETAFAYRRIAQTIERQTSSFNSGKICTIKAEERKDTLIHARNVLAILPGSDPKLKNEYIMIGGHADHIGLGEDGSVNNGADDNASGPAVALGIAKAMVKNKFKPKRSIVFVAWTGEEKGLWGSRKWCENPSLDLKKIVVYFNLDMVGLGDGKFNMPGTEFAPEVYNFIVSNSDSSMLENINWRKGGLGGSDHNHFLVHGVPAFAGMTSGSHPDYHTPADDADKIKPEILQLVGDFLYYCTEKISLSNEDFISEKRFAENKLKLEDFNILYPVSIKSFNSDLGTNAQVGIVEYSKIAVSNDAKENFLSLLQGIDASISSNQTSENFVFASTAYEALTSGRSGRTGIISAFRPESIDMNETYFKVLAKFGFRMIILDETPGMITTPQQMVKLMTLSSENGVGVIADNLKSGELQGLLSIAKDPILILAKNSESFTETVFKQISEGKHLLVYQLNTNISIAENLKKFTELSSKTGEENISFAPSGLQNSDKDFFNEFLLSFISSSKSPNSADLMLTGNFLRFAAESMQIQVK